jgi:transcriptional regulator of heat shock response
MEKRKEKLLLSVIHEYIKKATPVASKMLAGRGGFKISSATLRNEMADLEEEGYLIQPHTSAGRIPTEAGFAFYLASLSGRESVLDNKEKRDLERAARATEYPEKSLAKVLAELSEEAVILAFGKNDVYYTGLSNLFAKPEFHDQDLVYRIGEVVDHLDEIINEIFDDAKAQKNPSLTLPLKKGENSRRKGAKVEDDDAKAQKFRKGAKSGGLDDVQVLVGRDNPFSADCGAVVSRYCGKNKKVGLVAVLGPIRMDYGKNIALVREVKDLLNKI